MKYVLKIIIIIACLPAFFQPVVSQAQPQPRLRLVTTATNVVVKQEITIEVRVEGATAVYGSELHLTFDPNLLEVVELQHGDFLSPDPENQAFVLQNEADNEAGTIDYALSLLNPAPPVEGEGVLLRVIFQAKGAGQTTIEFTSGLFGNQAGEEIVASVEGLSLTIGEAGGDTPDAQETGNEPQPIERDTSGTGGDNSSTLLGLSLVLGGVVLVIGGVVAVALLTGIWFLVARSRGNK